MIQIDQLTEADIGRKVIFTYMHGERVEGELSSWNPDYIFVRFKGPNGEACEPNQLEFAIGGPTQ